MKENMRLVVLASGFGSNLQAIIDACTENQLSADVVAILSDRETAYSLERAHQHKIPAEYHPWKPYRLAGKSRQEYDADLAEIVGGYQPDYIVLAGWMRLLSMSFLDRFHMQVINLHPALPDTFPGTHAIERAYQAFQKGDIGHTGVMVHFVPDEGVDDGPIILQTEVPINTEDTLEILEQRVQAIEHQLLIEALSKVISETP